MARKHGRVVYAFTDVDSSLTPDELGGKGAGLVSMTRAGLPVPPGFIILSGVSRAYRQHSVLPKCLEAQVRREITALEKQTGRKLGDPERPLLLSVRSGAKVSMPGMMDTILNLGMTDDVITSLAKEHGVDFARAAYRQWAATSLDAHGSLSGWLDSVDKSWEEEGIPLTPESLLKLCNVYRRGLAWSEDPIEFLMGTLELVCGSWDSERAVAYRQVHGIPDRLGTAIVVQTMVFGNLDENSGSGVVFSRNTATGEPRLSGEYLPGGQGEDVVSGARTPEPISYLEHNHPELYKELRCYVLHLEHGHRDVVDVEFTIERGALHLLQCRVAKRTAVAAVRTAVDMVREGLISEKEAVRRVPIGQLETAIEPSRFDPYELAEAVNDPGRLIARGIPASPGAVVGYAKIDRPVNGCNILFREETTPNDFEDMIASAAIVTAKGGETSHAAVVARGMGIPAVVGTEIVFHCEVNAANPTRIRSERVLVFDDDMVSVDGNSGVVVLGFVSLLPPQGPSAEVKQLYEWRNKYVTWRPKLNFKLAEQTFNVSQMLFDFYVVQAIEREAKRKNIVVDESARVKQELAHHFSEVFATYLVLAIAREIRHVWDGCLSAPNQNHPDVQFLRDTVRLNHSSSGEVQNRASNYLQAHPLHAIAFAGACERLFKLDGWDKRFGGEKWGEVAETLRLYLENKIPADVFVDRVFDLQHNGGVVFDKSPMLQYEDSRPSLHHLLDIKRTLQGTPYSLAHSLDFNYRYYKSPGQELLRTYARAEREGAT